MAKNKTTHELRWDGDKDVVGLVMVRVVVSSHIYFGLERLIWGISKHSSNQSLGPIEIP